MLTLCKKKRTASSSTFLSLSSDPAVWQQVKVCLQNKSRQKSHIKKAERCHSRFEIVMVHILQ